MPAVEAAARAHSTMPAVGVHWTVRSTFLFLEYATNLGGEHG